MSSVDSFLVHISEEPWSNYTKADYNTEQWHNACLIHQHEGAPESKNQCKLPVKTPQGTLNRAGVHAAAAALAGARGGVQASPEEKEKAARSLRGYYKQLDEEAPESLTHAEAFEEFLAHFGVKGMRWGVRRDTSSGGAPARRKPRGTVRKGLTKAGLALEAAGSEIQKGESKLIFLPQAYRSKAATATTARVLGQAVKVSRDPRYKGKDLKRNTKLRKAYLEDITKRAEKVYKEELANARGEAVKDFVQGTLDYRRERIEMRVPSNTVQHADDDDILAAFKLISDAQGYVVKVELDEGSIKHDDLEIELAHFGVKGMRWGVRRDEKALATASRLRRVSEGTASRREVAETFLGKGTKGYGGLIGVSRAGERAAAIEARVAKRQAKREASANAAPSQRSINKASTKAAREQTKKAADNATTKEDARWAKQASDLKTVMQVYNTAAKKMNDTEISRINNIPKYKAAGERGDLKRDTPVRRAYYKEYQKTFLGALKESTAQLPPSPSGKMQYTIKTPGVGDGKTPLPQWDVTVGNVRHAVDMMPNIKVETDEQGFITSISMDEMTQADFSDYFAHYGRKGMKWGVRRTQAELDADSEDVAKVKASKAVIAKNRGSTNPLSNKELQEVVTRMNLEQQYSRLTARPSKVQKGAKAVKTTLAVGNSVNQAIQFANSPAGKAIATAVSKTNKKK